MLHSCQLQESLLFVVYTVRSWSLVHYQVTTLTQAEMTLRLLVDLQVKTTQHVAQTFDQRLKCKEQ